MNEMIVNAPVRIKLLSSELASQIAAGEVIERPSSVLKEILENSIDAGATKIDVTVQRGGIQLITVRDNGQGIIKEDLGLALQQHATSKIDSVHDLTSISSLGFRGEALASINSVAHLTITSKARDAEQAWSISNTMIAPSAHPIGTTIAVQDLFYNVPARRKFLRSERTEYQHLEEVFRRIALSNFAVAFSMHNHDKLVKNLPVCNDVAAQSRRVIALCGQQVMTNAQRMDIEQNGMRLWGWLGSVEHARSQETHQYFFINQRVIRDRLINHAIREVYQPLCEPGKMPFYCLYLELDPISLDVNVHPTKHEVRFRDARIIHAFLTQALNECLGVKAIETMVHSYRNTSSVAFNQSNVSVPHSIVADVTSHESVEILTVIENKILIAKNTQGVIVIDIIAARKELLLQQTLLDTTPVILLPAQTAKLTVAIDVSEKFSDWTLALGFKIDRMSENSALIRSVPRGLQQEEFDSNVLFSRLHACYKNAIARAECFVAILDSINYTKLLNHSELQVLLRNITKLSRNAVRVMQSDEMLKMFKQ